MNEEALILPRRLAMRILAAAQVAQPRRIAGVVGYDSSGPVAFMPIRNSAPDAEQHVTLAQADRSAARFGLDGRGLGLWAYVVSHPTAAAEPTPQDFRESPYADAVHLVISLSTKGVLEMRAWQRIGTEPRERVLKIRD
jgi:proteasome lid subunit RPN8/RPN11